MRFTGSLKAALALSLSALIALTTLFLGSASAFALVTDNCANEPTQNSLKITPNHGKVFYIDSGQGQNVDAAYASYTVATTGTARSNLWVQLGNFTGGALGLANPADSIMPIGSLAANAKASSYFLLKATQSSTTQQSHVVRVFSGQPGLSGSTELYSCSFSFSRVSETIKAAANKVSGITQDSVSSGTLGDTFAIKVTGQTGTIGSGNAIDGSVIWLSAAGRSTWPTQALRLEKVAATYSKGGGSATFIDDISITLAQVQAADTQLRTAKSFDYVVVYTFRIIGATATGVKPSPLAQIASGTQMKHTDMAGVDTAATAGFATGVSVSSTINMSVTKSVGASLAVSGGTATFDYTVTLDNLGSSSVTVDHVVDTPASGMSYVANSVRFAGAVTTEPGLNSSGQLVFSGPLAIPASTSRTITYKMSVAACTSGSFSFSNSVVAKIGSVSIGSTATAFQEVTASGTCGSTTVTIDTQNVTLITEVATGPAQSVTTNSATITGTVDSNGTSGLPISFRWGTSPTLLSSTITAAGTTTSSTSPVAQSLGLTGLSAGTIYYYRIAAGSEGNEVLGQILSFVTTETASVPTAVTGTARNLAASGSNVSATLSGAIDPNQVASGVKVRFQWATDSSSGACSALGGTVTAPSSTTFLAEPLENGARGADVLLGGSFATEVTLDVPDSINTTATFQNNTYYCFRIVGLHDASWSTAVAGNWVSFYAKVRLAQSITFPQPSVSGNSGTAAATASSNLVVRYVSQTTDVCTVDAESGAITVLSSGICTITASQAGDVNYEPALDVSQSVLVSYTAPLSITTNSLPDGTYGSSYSANLAATGGSGSYSSYTLKTGSLPAGLSLATDGTISGIPTAAGTIIDLEFTVTDSAGATSVVKKLSVTISPATLTVTAPSATVSYGDPEPSLTPKYTGFVGTDDATVLNTSPSCSSTYTTTTAVAFSPVSVTCANAADDNYIFDYVAGAITISKKNVSVQAASLARDYGDPIGSIPQPTYSGFAGTDTYTVLTTAVTCSTTYTATSNVGSTPTVSCSGGVAANYSFEYLTGSVVVSKAPQTINLGSYSSMLANQTRTLVPSTTSGEPPTITRVSGDCSYDSATGVVTAASTLSSPPQACVLSASVGSTSNYLSAGPVTLTIQVSNVALTEQSIRVSDLTRTYGEGAFESGATATSGLTVSLSTSDDTVVSVSGNTITIVGVGTATVMASQAGDASYNPAPSKTFTVTVTKAMLTVIGPVESVTYGDLKPTLGASYSGFKYADTASNSISTAAVCDASYTATTAVASSPVTVTCSGAVAANYDFSYLAGSITINRAEILVNVPNSQRSYGEAVGAFAAEYSGWKNEQDPSVLITPASCSTTYTATTSAGLTRPINCSGATAANYRFSYQSGVLTVVKANQQLSASDVTKRYGDADFTPSVSVTSGLTPTLSSGTTSVASVTGGSRLQVRSIGQAVITVTQPGNSNFNAASPITFTVTVERAVLTVRALSGNIVVGSATPSLSPTYLGFVGNDNANNALTAPASCATSYNATAAVGSRHTTTCSGAAGTNYQLQYVDGQLVVIAAPVTGNSSSGSANNQRPATERPRVTLSTPAAAQAASQQPTSQQSIRPVIPPAASQNLPAAPPRSSSVDVGTGEPVKLLPKSSAMSALVEPQSQNRATRSIEDLRSEPTVGFAPQASVNVQVAGARTSAQFVLSDARQIDAAALAAALTESMKRNEADFASLAFARAANKPPATRVLTGPVSEDALEVFAASDLGTPRTLGSLDWQNASNWISVGANVAGYVPGSVVYLAVTTTPTIFAAALVDEQGAARFDGYLPIDVLEAGAHNLRIVGMRDLGGVTLADNGELKLSDDTMREIERFDNGTNAIVMATRDGDAGTHSAVRLVPLELHVPWWAFWVYAGLALTALVLLALRRRFATRISFVALAVGGSLLPFIAGWLSFGYEIFVPTIVVLVVSLLLGLVLELRRRGHKRRLA